MKLIINSYLCICLILLLTGCRKDIGKLPVSNDNPTSQPVQEPNNFSCVTFPDWFHAPPDSVTYPDKQMMYWQYRPGTKSEIVYTLGTQIWTYNFVTKQRHFITNNTVYLPVCNRKGWILYSDFKDLCIYKVKTNGDSLKRMTFDGSIGGNWDYTGTYIYYFCEAKNMLYKITENGSKLDSVIGVPAVFSAFSKKSDKIYYNKAVNGMPSLVCLDMSTKKEEVVTTSASGRHIAIDDREENFYFRSMDDPKWALIKYNVATKKVDTLLKDCDNILWTWPSISANTNKVTIGCIFTKFLDPKTDPSIKKPKLLKWTKAFEIDLDDPTNKLNEINLFPQL